MTLKNTRTFFNVFVCHFWHKEILYEILIEQKNKKKQKFQK